jgi:hypothetical protein
MKKLLFFSCAVFVLACNNQSATGESGKDTAARSASPTVMTHLSAESEMEILEGCIDNAKASKLDETKAYALCRCVLRQVQEKYPSADSTALVDHMSDSTEMVQMVKKCQ